MAKEYIEMEAALIEIGDADDTMDAERRVWALPAADVVEVSTGSTSERTQDSDAWRVINVLTKTRTGAIRGHTGGPTSALWSS